MVPVSENSTGCTQVFFSLKSSLEGDHNLLIIELFYFIFRGDCGEASNK